MAQAKKKSTLGFVTKPMGRTIRQFYGSFIRGKPNTVLYPYQKLDLPPTYRGKHTLDFKRCIGCSNCVQICPNNCMWMQKLEDPELGKIERPGIDMGRCLFCGLCVEVCPTVAIHETVEFELANSKRDKIKFDPRELRDDSYADKIVEERRKHTIPVLDLDKCTGCEKCAGECPEMCIAMMPIEGVGKNKPEFTLGKCEGEGKCVVACAEKALTMKDSLRVVLRYAGAKVGSQELHGMRRVCARLPCRCHLYDGNARNRKAHEGRQAREAKEAARLRFGEMRRLRQVLWIVQVRGHRYGGGGRIAFDWELLVFLSLSLVTLVSALMVIRTKEIVHSVIYLATCFIAVAALYVMLTAEFVAIIQILVYVGAVIVVILFGIMLTKREIMESEKR